MTAVARPHAPAPAFSEPLRRALAQGLVLLDAEVAGRLEPVVDWLVAWDEAFLADWGVPSAPARRACTAGRSRSPAPGRCGATGSPPCGSWPA